MKHSCLCLIMIAGLAFFSRAQTLVPDVIASAGDFFTGKNGSIGWTLGEAATETLSSETSLLTQGFHQPHLQIVRVDTLEDPNVDVSVYPNPVNDLLTIEITSSEKNPCLRLELFNVEGQRIYDHSIHCQDYHEQLDVSQFSSSLFVLRVTNLNTRITGSFKIHKIKF